MKISLSYSLYINLINYPVFKFLVVRHPRYFSVVGESLLFNQSVKRQLGYWRGDERRVDLPGVGRVSLLFYFYPSRLVTFKHRSLHQPLQTQKKPKKLNLSEIYRESRSFRGWSIRSPFFFVFWKKNNELVFDLNLCGIPRTFTFLTVHTQMM